MLVYGKNVFNELSNNSSNIRKIYLSNNLHERKIYDLINKNNLK